MTILPSGETRITERVVAWSILAALGATDLVGCHFAALRVDKIWPILVAVAILLGATRFLVRRQEHHLATLTDVTARMIALGFLAALLTYLAAAVRAPFIDDWLAGAGIWLGFDWLAWHRFIAARPALSAVLGLAYASMGTQFLLAVLYYPLVRRSERAKELFWLTLISILLTTAVFAALPARDPWFHFGMGSEMQWTTDLIAMHGHAMHSIASFRLTGIVSFPSFHTVMAILLAYTARGMRFMPAAVVLNAIMILSTLSQGHHYLADVIAGVIVAAATIGLLHAIQRKQVSGAAAIFAAMRLDRDPLSDCTRV